MFGLFCFLLGVLALPFKSKREKTEKTLATLKHLLSGFPFANKVDESVARAALLTAVLRAAFPFAPMTCAWADRERAILSTSLPISSSVELFGQQRKQDAGRKGKATRRIAARRCVATSLDNSRMIWKATCWRMLTQSPV
jgi:hypothetical protein